jgi:hypothetical protein
MSTTKNLLALLDKIEAYDDVERRGLSQLIYAAHGRRLDDDGCLHQLSDGCGNYVSGFALDLRSLRFKLTDEYGYHWLAKQELIWDLEGQGLELKKARIVVGLICWRVEGVSFPIAAISIGRLSLEELRQVAGYCLASERGWLPLTFTGQSLRTFDPARVI